MSEFFKPGSFNIELERPQPWDEWKTPVEGSPEHLASYTILSDILDHIKSHEELIASSSVARPLSKVVREGQLHDIFRQNEDLTAEISVDEIARKRRSEHKEAKLDRQVTLYSHPLESVWEYDRVLAGVRNLLSINPQFKVVEIPFSVPYEQFRREQTVQYAGNFLPRVRYDEGEHDQMLIDGVLVGSTIHAIFESKGGSGLRGLLRSSNHTDYGVACAKMDFVVGFNEGNEHQRMFEIIKQTAKREPFGVFDIEDEIS